MEKEVYKRHIANFSKHWWFQARKEIIESVIKKNIKKKNLRILDFGSGSGVNIKMLSKFGHVSIFELDQITKKYLKKKYKGKRFKVVEKIDNNKFDLIVLADVLEHIKNDKSIAKKLIKLLNKNGLILITVPAFKILFSKKDLILGHYRRYQKKEITSIFNNLKIIKLTFINFLLFIPISLSIVILKVLNIDFIDNVEKSPPKLVNNLLYNIFVIEKKLISFLNLPFGISLLGLFQKK